MKYEAEKPKPSLFKAPCASNAASATSSSSSKADAETSFPVQHICSSKCSAALLDQHGMQREAVRYRMLPQCGIASSRRVYTILAQLERITERYLRLLGQPNTTSAQALPKTLQVLDGTAEASTFVAPSAWLPAMML